jgi:hypothetical protein
MDEEMEEQSEQLHIDFTQFTLEKRIICQFPLDFTHTFQQ